MAHIRGHLTGILLRFPADHSYRVHLTPSISSTGPRIGQISLSEGAYAWTKVGIGIEGPVHADYAVSPVSGTAPLDVTFTDLSTGFPERYNLSFGDGIWSNTSSLSSVVHTYPSTGVYSPVLYVNNSINSDSGTNTTYPDITVSSDPIAIIGAGGTVFIGESGLDITAAVPVNSSIAWWPPMSDINITAPTKIIASPNRSSFFVSPTNFVGYTGDWYVYTGLPPPASLAFIVKDPQLDLGIEDVSKGTDITNGTLQRGDELGFLINSNLFNGAPGTPLSIIVRSPSGTNYSALVNKVGTTTTLSSILVSSQPFNTGALWDTSNGLYPVGAYTVHAECNVNGMKDNYKNGGVDYVGKTVSQAYTITLVSPVTTSSVDYGGGSGDSSAAPASAAAPPVAAPPVAAAGTTGTLPHHRQYHWPQHSRLPIRVSQLRWHPRVIRWDSRV